MQSARSTPLWSVRTLLLWLVLACLLPGVIGAVFLFIQQYHVGHALLEKDTLQTTRAISQAIDHDLAALQGKLQILSLSSALKSNDIPTFYRRAQEVLATETLAAAIGLIDSTGQQVMNTLLPLGAELPKTGHPASVRQTFETGRSTVSDLYIGGAARRPFVSLEMPVRREGKVTYALDIGIPAERFAQILLHQKLPENWGIALVDSQGVIVARSHNAESFVGQKAVPELVERMLVAPEGTFEATTLEGTPAFLAYIRSPLTNWSVAIAIPRQSLEAELMRTITLLGLGIGLLFCMGLGLAWYMGGRIARSVKALTAPAVALEAGEVVVVPQVQFREADEVAQAMAHTALLLKQRTLALQESLVQLQERESDLSRAQHIAELGSWHWDAKTDTVTVSEEMRQIFGHDVIPPFVQQIETIYPRKAWQQLNAAVQNAVQTGSGFDLELPALRGDGSPIWINTRGEAVHDASGEIIGIRGTAQNITERKQRNEKQRISDLALKSISQGVLITDADGRILSANGAFVSITGFSETEILGRKCDFLQGPLTDPQMRAGIGVALKNAVEFSGEILNYRKDGATFWNELTISPTVNGQGQLTHFIGITRDITARKEAELELEQHRQHLEQLVCSRTEELILARDMAESANQAKSSFLSTMSHELRTPLNAVVGLTGLLADSRLNRRQRDYADKIQLSARALCTLIDDILDFSKIEAGALQMEQAPFSLKAILRTIAAVVGVSLRDKPIEALIDVPPDIPDALIGDALRLQQILLNLTSNATKFTEAGSIVVSVRCIDRAAERVTLEFVVRDTGIGIASEQLDSIFDGFIQADSSTSRLYGGSGLGLAISARLAHLMGGRIEVESEVGTGSEFRFRLPLMLGRAESQPALEEHLCGLNILIVEDHPLARDILTKACVGFGWQATAVEDGAAGLNELRRSAEKGRYYDLLLLDWRMPGMDGLEMLRQAYATPGIGLPLVVLMASMFELEQAAAVSDDLHLDGIAAKPMTPSSLFEAVMRAYSGEYISILPAQGKTDRRLAGMRLLVAEDNALNQEVIQEILIRAGAEVVIANNGLAVVEALRKPGSRFDAVLMDIQMPIMDGYTATRIIREELGLVDLPIIAVTAFARPEDREKSRLAGMVGHLVKPLDVEDLLDVVDKRRQSSPGNFADNTGTAAESLVPAINFAGLDVIAALKAFGTGDKKYLKLLRKFILQHGNDAAEARRLFCANDPQGAERIVHGLSGMASMLQATDLARLAAVADSALMSGKVDVMLSLFDELQVAMHTLKQSVKQIEAMWAEA